MQEEIFLDNEDSYEREILIEPKIVNKHWIIEIWENEIIPIVISNQKTPELILGQRFNDEKN